MRSLGSSLVLSGSLLCALVLAGVTPALAQPVDGPPIVEGEGRLFGMEFEFAGRGNRVVDFEEMKFENYEKLMREVVRYYGGDPSTIKRINFEKASTNLEKFPSGKRTLFRAEWTDNRGRKWMIEPEFVASSGYDGYELVTPPLADPKEVEGVLTNIRNSGLVREGLKSGVHLTIDARDMIKPNGDARALANLIVMHENMEPMLRRVFNPVRGGGYSNRFARSIAVDHPDILKEIDALQPQERTRANLEAIFKAREAREATLQEVDPMDPETRVKNWKYRSMNLAKALDINPLHEGKTGVVEFRMFDLDALKNPATHGLEAELYRAMVDKAKAMAEAGETVRYQPRAEMPAGENPSVYNTPQDPNEAKAAAREMIEKLGLDPTRFETLLSENVAKHRYQPTTTEFKGLLDQLPRGRVEHNGKAFTYGFELEGSGEGFARMLRPKDAATNARWDTMSDPEKYSYYREKVGADRKSVPTHFNLDLVKYPFLDPNWKVEYTGNWEIRSLPFESVGETTDRMREVKALAGKSAKGFHLHMRDNGVDWGKLEAKGTQLADFIERSSNWVWMERARKLGTMTSMKSWSNARMKPGDIENIANMKSSQRATIRSTVPHDKSYLDLEIRGFTKDVDNIERLAKIYTEALKTGNFGPWEHTANVLPMTGQGAADKSLRFVDHMEEYFREVEGKEMTPEMRKVVDGLQNEYGTKAKGDARTYATNVATALLPWDKEMALDESTRRDLKFQKEEYLRSIRFTANKVMSGEFGLDLSVANETAMIKHLGITEAEAKALVDYRSRGGEL
ncbi:MAG: amidoligase family protein, partial [Planctomycetes bacterium]|nr:amidoligase family protein [Planctomycetota bacterium]